MSEVRSEELSEALLDGRPSKRLGMQPWALSLPDKELCLREALAVCTPPASPSAGDLRELPRVPLRGEGSCGGGGANHSSGTARGSVRREAGQGVIPEGSGRKGRVFPGGHD